MRLGLCQDKGKEHRAPIATYLKQGQQKASNKILDKEFEVLPVFFISLVGRG